MMKTITDAQGRKLITPGDACRLARVHRATLKRWRDEGMLETVKGGPGITSPRYVVLDSLFQLSELAKINYMQEHGDE